MIEVSTFRKHAGFSDEGELLIKSDNTFGTPEEDARRRDFTINGLFYDPVEQRMIDFVGGQVHFKIATRNNSAAAIYDVKVVLDLTLLIHGYQGLLAFVILLFWHLYSVHLHPSVFPMNNAWLTGKVDAEWLKEEHPGEYDKLKGEGVL